jgi:hypothetical protein
MNPSTERRADRNVPNTTTVSTSSPVNAAVLVKQVDGWQCVSNEHIRGMKQDLANKKLETGSACVAPRTIRWKGAETNDALHRKCMELATWLEWPISFPSRLYPFLIFPASRSSSYRKCIFNLTIKAIILSHFVKLLYQSVRTGRNQFWLCVVRVPEGWSEDITSQMVVVP